MPRNPARSWQLVAVLLLVTAVIHANAVSAQSLEDGTPPNIVVFLSDDMGWGQPGFNGGDEVETPSMDRIAEEGIKLTQFYVAPVCTATRGALLTGRYSWKNGTGERFNGRTSMGMRVDERTLAESLRDAGYATWLVGKWHLDNGSTSTCRCSADLTTTTGSTGRK